MNNISSNKNLIQNNKEEINFGNNSFILDFKINNNNNSLDNFQKYIY